MLLRPSVAHVAFDADLFDRLRGALVSGALGGGGRLTVAPPPLGPGDLIALDPAARERRRARGEAALRAGSVAALILNGGMATRFGGVVKGVVPVLPERPALSFLAVKLAGVRTAGPGVPAVLMHSFATAAASREHLAAIDWSGVAPIDRLEFEQSLLPRVLSDGTPIAGLAGAEVLPDVAVYAAPGHGDTLRRVTDSGTLAALRERGVEHVLVSNVDNLGASLDPEVLGAHLEAVDGGAELSVEVVPRAPGDAGGCVALLAGRPAIVEGFRLPAGVDLASYPHFNTNTLWLTRAVLERAHPLTWFAVERQIEWPGRGDLAVVQFEQLIGQITEFARTACLAVDRGRFLPIKTREDLTAAGPALAAIVASVGLGG